MPAYRIDYIELPVPETVAARSFYERAFGWSLTDFAPTYSATTGGDVDIGLQADPAQRLRAPLPIVRATNLESALAAVKTAGGAITRPISRRSGRSQTPTRSPRGKLAAKYRPVASNATSPT